MTSYKDEDETAVFERALRLSRERTLKTPAAHNYERVRRSGDSKKKVVPRGKDVTVDNRSNNPLIYNNQK